MIQTVATSAFEGMDNFSSEMFNVVAEKRAAGLESVERFSKKLSLATELAVNKPRTVLESKIKYHYKKK